MSATSGRGTSWRWSARGRRRCRALSSIGDYDDEEVDDDGDGDDDDGGDDDDIELDNNDNIDEYALVWMMVVEKLGSETVKYNNKSA